MPLTTLFGKNIANVVGVGALGSLSAFFSFAISNGTPSNYTIRVFMLSASATGTQTINVTVIVNLE